MVHKALEKAFLSVKVGGAVAANDTGRSGKGPPREEKTKPDLSPGGTHE